MGNESSHEIIGDDVPSRTLERRDLASVAKLIKDGKAKKIVVMTGAGISTSAGIPDFRSPGTGLYANLARLNLPYPEAVFDISFFRQNPDPFYLLAQELYPGKFKPTVAHSFIALLAKKNLLRMLFTQNIDCLERTAGVPDDLIVEAHGSFATQRCIECKTEYPDEMMLQAVNEANVPHCIVPQCNGLVKPDIVFFGEALPERFHQNRSVPALSDLAIIIGTSLTVQPFASLPQFVPEDVPRVLFNMEHVGGLGSRADDVCILGDCDSGVRKLADELGWREELEAEWTKVSGKTADEAVKEWKSKDEEVADEVEKLTRDIDSSLKVSDSHIAAVNKNLEDKPKKKDRAADSSKSEPSKRDLAEQYAATSVGGETHSATPNSNATTKPNDTTSTSSATDTPANAEKVTEETKNKTYGDAKEVDTAPKKDDAAQNDATKEKATGEQGTTP